MNLENPLSKAQISNLEKALYRANAGLNEIERARAAGMDVEERMLRLNHQKQRILQLLEQYRLA